MKVVAMEKGYFGEIRSPGDMFDIPSAAHMGTWMAPATKEDEKELSKPKARRKAVSKPADTNTDPLL